MRGGVIRGRIMKVSRRIGWLVICLWLSACTGAQFAGGASGELSRVLSDYDSWLDDNDVHRIIFSDGQLKALPALTGEAAAARAAQLNHMKNRLAGISERRLARHELRIKRVLALRLEQRWLQARHDLLEMHSAPPRLARTTEALAARIRSADPGSARSMDIVRHWMQAYSSHILQQAGKLERQAQGGVRVPAVLIDRVQQGFQRNAELWLDSLSGFNRRLAAVDQQMAQDFQREIDEWKNTALRQALNAVDGVFDEAYRSAAPEEGGLWQHEGGQQYYRVQLKHYLGVQDDPHDLLLEAQGYVAELEQAIAGVRRQLNFKGSREDFQQYLASNPARYAGRFHVAKDRLLNMAAELNQAMQRYFNRLPRTPYAVLPLEQPASGSGYYSPASRHQRIGIFWLDVDDLSNTLNGELTYLAAHELVPGRHFLYSLQREQYWLPAALANPEPNDAFMMAWSEYAAWLAEESGVIDTPLERYGRLSIALRQAAVAVVDIGINFYRWSFEDAKHFLAEFTLAGEGSRQQDEVFWETMEMTVLAHPGLSTAHHLGFRRIRDLRDQSKGALKRRFDIAQFHDFILANGSVPMPLLDELVNDYIDDVRSGRTRRGL